MEKLEIINFWSSNDRTTLLNTLRSTMKNGP
jgi:hypothetical protein